MHIKMTEPVLSIEIRADAGSRWREFASYREADSFLRDLAMTHSGKPEVIVTWVNGQSYETTVDLKPFRAHPISSQLGLATMLRRELYGFACGPCEGELAARTLNARDLVDLCSTGKDEDLELPVTLKIVCKFCGMNPTEHSNTVHVEKPIARTMWLWELVDRLRGEFSALYQVEPEQVEITRL